VPSPESSAGPYALELTDANRRLGWSIDVLTQRVADPPLRRDYLAASVSTISRRRGR
jgi:hypothetical protein